MSNARRSPTPPPLRAPSPLGGRYLVTTDNGSIRSLSPPVRSPTSPKATGPARSPLRPPSPIALTPSSSLRSPVIAERAMLTSRRESQKINCAELRHLLEETTEKLGRVAGALVVIQEKITISWKTPQRVVRASTLIILSKLVLISTHLIKYMSAISTASSIFTQYLGSTIEATHLGRQATREDVDTRPLVDKLRALHLCFAQLSVLEAELGQVLKETREQWDLAMDPDRWVAGSKPTSLVRAVASAHVDLGASFVALAAFFKDLTSANWKPPLLSPDDLRDAADQWRRVQKRAHRSAQKIRDAIKKLLAHSTMYDFLKRSDGERLLHLLLDDQVDVGEKARDG